MIQSAEPKSTPALDTSYSRGLHIVASLTSDQKALLNDYQYFKGFINQEIEALGLAKVGEVYHNFSEGGFTGVVCLSESHLSIHTWPELNYVTFDVFLSNFLRDNSQSAHQIYNKTVAFLGAIVRNVEFISR